MLSTLASCNHNHGQWTCSSTSQTLKLRRLHGHKLKTCQYFCYHWLIHNCGGPKTTVQTSAIPPRPCIELSHPSQRPRPRSWTRVGIMITKTTLLLPRFVLIFSGISHSILRKVKSKFLMLILDTLDTHKNWHHTDVTPHRHGYAIHMFT